MRKFIVTLLILASLGLVAASVGGCGNRLNLGTSTTYNANTTTTWVSGGK